MSEAKAGLKAKLEAELGATSDETELADLKAKFSAEERAIEHEIDHKMHSFSAVVDMSYNVRACPVPTRHPFATTPTRPCPALAVPFQVRGDPAAPRPCCNPGPLARTRRSVCRVGYVRTSLARSGG